MLKVQVFGANLLPACCFEAQLFPFVHPRNPKAGQDQRYPNGN